LGGLLLSHLDEGRLSNRAVFVFVGTVCVLCLQLTLRSACLLLLPHALSAYSRVYCGRPRLPLALAARVTAACLPRAARTGSRVSFSLSLSLLCSVALTALNDLAARILSGGVDASVDQLLGRDCGEQVMIAFNCCDKKFKCSIVATICAHCRSSPR
jgi:hypothetical protein